MVKEHGGTPRRDQCTSGDKDEGFYAFDAESPLLRPLEPAFHIVSDVVLEQPMANGVFAVAVMRKAQECPMTPAPVCETFETARMSADSNYLGQDCDSLTR